MPKSLSDKRFDSLSDHVLGGLPEISVSRTYSLTFRHIQLVKEMWAQIPGNGGGQNRISEGRIVREAIELFVEHFDPEMFDEDSDVISEASVREHPAFRSVSGETVSGRADRSQTGAGFLSGVFRDR